MVSVFSKERKPKWIKEVQVQHIKTGRRSGRGCECLGSTPPHLLLLLPQRDQAGGWPGDHFSLGALSETQADVGGLESAGLRGSSSLPRARLQPQGRCVCGSLRNSLSGSLFLLLLPVGALPAPICSWRECPSSLPPWVGHCALFKQSISYFYT